MYSCGTYIYIMNTVRRHPYVFVSIISLLAAVLVWWFTPKEYGAQTKIYDEYKETDLSVGLNSLNVTVRDLIGSENKGINDVEVYCRILKSYDFARKLAKVTVPAISVEYGKYLGEKDTLDAIKDNVSYKLSTLEQSLIIQFNDRDQLVAAQMLDSVTAILQNVITEKRQKANNALLVNAAAKRERAKKNYEVAIAKYAAFVDSNANPTSASVAKVQEALLEETNNLFSIYSKANEEYVRYDLLQKRSYNSFAVVKCNSVPLHYTSYLIGYVLFALFVSICSVKGYRLYKERRGRKHFVDFGGASSPWCITLVVWSCLMFAMIFRDPTLLNPPTEMFYTSIVLWLVFFTIASFVTYTLLPCSGNDINEVRKSAASPIELKNINRVMFYFFLFLSIVITPLYLKKIMEVVMMFGTDDLFKNMRDLAVYGNDRSFLNYAVVINETLMIVALWAYPNIKRWQLFVACAGCLLNSIAIMEKGGILLVVFSIIFILYQRSYIKVRTIVIIGVSIIFLSYGFNMLRLSEDELNSSDDYSLFSFIACYLLSPPVAYCTLTREIVPQFGAHTFPLVYLFMNKFGMGSYVFFDRLQEFVFVPVSTNVYTILQPFYMDFGQFGVAVFAVIYGILTGWAYRMMRNGSAFGKCFYMYLAYALALQFFQEYIFTGNLHIIQLIVFLFLCTQDRFRLSFKKNSADI